MQYEYRLGKRGGEFVVTWWENGHRRRYRLFAPQEGAEVRTKAEAERRLRQFAQDASKEARKTVQWLWDAYRADNAGKPATANMEHTGKAILPHFGELLPSEILPDTCRAYIARRRSQGRQDGTIWTELGHLRTVLTWSAKHRHIDHAPHVERPPKPKSKDRYLTRPEAMRLVGAADGHIKVAILLMLTTACRVGAALDLTWDRVDFERRQINLQLPDTTTRKGRAVVPMNDTLLNVLQDARKAALTDNVVEWAGEPVASIKKGFRLAVARAGLQGVTPHVLRHTAAVWMAAAGRPIPEIAQYLGHSNPSITFKVYARYQPDHLRQAAAALDLFAA